MLSGTPPWFLHQGFLRSLPLGCLQFVALKFGPLACALAQVRSPRGCGVHEDADRKPCAQGQRRQ